MATKIRNNKTKKTTKSDDTIVKTYDYVVEHNVQITSMRHSNLSDKFPFEIMKQGDSFLIPAKDPVAKKPNMLHYAAKQFAKIKPGFALTSRMQLNGERRVWRIK
jgi:hypothetical protein